MVSASAISQSLENPGQALLNGAVIQCTCSGTAMACLSYTDGPPVLARELRGVRLN